MKTDNDLERRLRDVLRQELDRENGPDPRWDESPAARRVTEQGGRRPSRWTLRVLAVAALITIGGGAALLLGAPDDPPALGHNGWIAYGVSEPDPEGQGDQDIWFVSLDQEPRRVIGSDTDSANEVCPAFSPDGRHLAYGRVAGQAATLVIADVADDGHVTDQFTADVGDGLPPPCPVWSPLGDRIAFGVPQTSPINPTQSAEGSEVWILTLANRGITVLPDLLATDLEWSPDGSLLGVSSGREEVPYGEALADGRIYLYSVASGQTRTLEGTLGAINFSWSPDGVRIVYMTGDFRHALRVIDLATEEQRNVSEDFEAIHGIGPVWSPDGESIVYQRCPSFCNGETHEVVLVWPDDLLADGTPREEVIPLVERPADGEGPDESLRPYWVTWSPDGAYLMFAAWSFQIDPMLGAIPSTPGSLSDILVNDQDVAVNPGYDGGPFVPIQTWQRRPADAAMPTPNPEESAVGPTPSPSAWVGLPAGPHGLLEQTDSGVPITVTIAAPLWNGEPNGGSLCWGDPADPCADPSGGVGLRAFEGGDYSVYGEACTWASTRPDTPATTVDELIDAMANQGSRAESAREDITVDGYAGTRILLPMHPVDIDRCDEGHVALFGLPGTDPARYTQDQDLIEEVWAVDVDGLIVVLDATYYADTAQNVLDEVRAIVQSATFD